MNETAADDVQKAAHRYHLASKHRDMLRDALADKVRAAVVQGGMSQSAAARLAGVNRLTVRDWISKA